MESVKWDLVGKKEGAEHWDENGDSDSENDDFYKLHCNDDGTVEMTGWDKKYY